jgi:urea transport system permease protein
MSAAITSNRNLELIGFALIALLIIVILPLSLDIFRLNLVGKKMK